MKTNKNLSEKMFNEEYLNTTTFYYIHNKEKTVKNTYIILSQIIKKKHYGGFS